MNTGRVIQQLKGSADDGIKSIAFSPDGKLLASAEDKAINLWRVSNGSLINTLTYDITMARTVAFSPDGQILALAGHDYIRLWRVLNGSPLNILKGPKGFFPISMAFSPDGQVLAGADFGTVWLFRVMDGRILLTLKGPNDRIIGLGFNPNGQTVVSGGLEYIRKWRVSDGRVLSTSLLPKWYADKWFFNASVFSPNGQTLLWAMHGRGDDWFSMIRLCRVSDGRLVVNLDVPTDFGVSSVAFSGNGEMLAAGDSKGRILIWSNKTDHPVKPLSPM